MGLLDDLLGQLAAGSDAPARPAPRTAAAGGGMGPILMALLPVVLAMLRSRGDTAPAGAARDGGGGLGDLLGQVLGGAAAGGGALGGLGALLEQLQRAGFGEQARSWVGPGRNLPLPPGASEQIFGPGGIAEIARRAGLSEADTSRGLAELMPEVVDRVTPRGAVPSDGSELLASVEDLARKLGI